jgi:hypothetical protein
MKKLIFALVSIILIISVYADPLLQGPPTGNGVAPPPGGSLGNLEITSVSASPSRPEPGEEVKVKVKLKNNADEDIEDIDLTIDLDGLENDKGNELDDDKNFDLRSGRTKTITFRFDMPYEVADDDSYNINIDAKGTGEDSNNDYEVSDQSESITFNKDSHAIYIEALDLSPSVINCLNRFDVEYNILNIGSNDEEDVTVTISNRQLGIDYKQELELDEEDSYSDTARFTIEPQNR